MLVSGLVVRAAERPGTFVLGLEPPVGGDGVLQSVQLFWDDGGDPGEWYNLDPAIFCQGDQYGFDTGVSFPGVHRAELHQHPMIHGAGLAVQGVPAAVLTMARNAMTSRSCSYVSVIGWINRSEVSMSKPHIVEGMERYY